MSKANPFNLPPPWNPGYAVPQNVVDEGLERHGYTTAWTRRGTYDDPKVGHGGYDLPGYVRDEAYGQGAMTTRWAPRGWYGGPKVKHWLDHPSARVVDTTKLPGGATKVQIETLSGVEARATGGSAPFTSYGMSSARALLDTVKMLPPADRKKQLKRALDKIDPHLWARAEQGAAVETKAGVRDDVALERGLAAAMSLGISTELVDLGKGKLPPKRSQLGAVCFGCGALGDATPQPGDCTPDGQFIWIGRSGTVPGHWERMQPGDACGTAPTRGAANVQVVVHQSAAGFCQDAAGKVTLKPAGVDCPAGSTLLAQPPPALPPPSTSQKQLGIGPFLIPTDVGAYRDHRPLTDEKKQYVDENVAVAAKAGGISVAEMSTGKYPFVKFQVDGEAWGLYYQVKPDGSTVVAYHKMPANGDLSGVLSTIGGALKDVAETVGGAIWEVLKKIWKGIKWVAAKVVDFVEDAAKWVADKACDLMTSGVGQLAGAAAGAAVGGPAGAQAGAIGAQIAANACSGAPKCAAGQILGPDGKTCVPAPVAQKGSSLLPVLLIGGAGIAAVLVLGGKKKRP